ncbi:hypothetical protein CHS0354_023871 [Potamilus streckersoni]|uniref:Translation factor GUF1 homolog, mitochondrial n=1 Tax=Potamilus streckersoni TaxID=2493646 RepID=A0AAE0VMN7_9BIVA|nr:hypothetical protein CHS0354_023871 [Potamilus streckersoni]
MKNVVDITIVGAGPTGLYAAFYAGLRGMTVRLVDALPEVGGQLTALYPKKNIYDVAGFPAVVSEDLVKNLYSQALQYHPDVLTECKITSIVNEEGVIKLSNEAGALFFSKAVLIACGVGAFTPRRLANPNFVNWENKGLYYFVKDPKDFYGKKVLIIGGGDSAMDWAMALAAHADLTLIHRRDKFIAHEDSITKVFSFGFPIKTFFEIDDIRQSSQGSFKEVSIKNTKTKEKETLLVDAVLCNLGFVTNLGPIKDWGLELKGNGIVVDSFMRTNLKGVYAAGDITSHSNRLLEFTGTVSEREKQDQILDDLDLERERGITIKSHAIQMAYRSKHDGLDYILNLIDTPGHVDFAYEVSRSLAACEGALLLVDASQGVEAQTIANLYLAVEAGLEIIPIVTKVDLPSADPERIKGQIVDLIGGRKEDILLASAKAKIGIQEILEAVISRIPPPVADVSKPLRALIFDSYFDEYRGAVAFIRLMEGTLKKGDKIKFFANEKSFTAEEIGILKLKREQCSELRAGNVGYLICSIKDVKDTKVGDTVTHLIKPASERLPGYKEAKPMVFSGIYPTMTEDFETLREALEKLALNDASLSYVPESSVALGFGFRCGFLGLLHMEIIQERLEREYGMNIITTAPNVEYQVFTTARDTVIVDNPSKMPDAGKIDRIEEPYICAQIITTHEFIGGIMTISMDRRGEYKDTKYIDSTRAVLTIEFPLAEIIFDFYDKLKSISKGYASMDYEAVGYRESDLIKLDILLNGESVDALSMIVHRSKSYEWGKKYCSKLKEQIPRQMFEVAIQASIGSRVISRETISAMRKNVTAKCYGGDISRKRKLLEKQKEGKKRMKNVGRVEVPQEAFLAVLSINDD